MFCNEYSNLMDTCIDDENEIAKIVNESKIERYLKQRYEHSEINIFMTYLNNFDDHNLQIFVKIN